jgi:hypothetical protein
LAAALALLAFLAPYETATAQMQAQKAVTAFKLAIETNAKSYRVGDKAEIEVVIQDVNNKAVKADKEYKIELEIRTRAGKVKTMQDTIKAGATSKKFQVQLEDFGSIEIRARHQAKIPQLKEGSTFIKVGRRLIRTPQGAVMPGLDWRFAAGSVMAQLPTSPSPSGLPANQDSLDIKNSPQRILLANKKDSATIHVFLYTKSGNEEGVATKAIKVRLFNSSGNPNPINVLIPQGDDYGEAKLVSDQVGIVNVEYLGATPLVKPPTKKKLEIKFGPPISQLVFETSPPSISLVDTADLIVRLVDENNQPIATDTSRLVSFAIDTGRGEIRKDEIDIAKGRADGRSSFLPTWRGEVILSAATPNLPLAPAKLKVELPGSLLGLSGLGGLVGGLIAFLTRQGSKWWRTAIGLVTGFVLYWAFVFGVLNAIPRFIVLNPLSAFALSTLGGWLGTEAFNQILKLLKLPSGGQSSGGNEA